MDNVKGCLRPVKIQLKGFKHWLPVKFQLNNIAKRIGRLNLRCYEIENH